MAECTCKICGARMGAGQKPAPAAVAIEDPVAAQIAAITVPPPEPVVDLTAMNVFALKAYAKREGIDVGEARTKQELIDAIASAPAEPIATEEPPAEADAESEPEAEAQAEAEETDEAPEPPTAF